MGALLVTSSFSEAFRIQIGARHCSRDAPAQAEILNQTGTGRSPLWVEAV
jgi:hypothetical protein